MLMKIISFILVFGTVTLAHEIGHFFFSRLAGIRVLELGLGFGPKLFSFVRNKTIYSLNLIPILGFVRIAGLDETGSDGRVPKKESYLSKKPGQKFMSIFGGPLFNMLLAAIIFYLMFTISGVPSGISNEIAMVSPGSEAQKAGIMPGDKVIMANSVDVTDMARVIENIHKNPGKSIRLTIERRTKTLKVSVTPQLNKKLGIGLIGISLKPVYIKTDPIKAIYQSLQQVVSTSVYILYVLGLLVAGKLSIFDLAGPVGIAQFTGQVAKEGLIPLLSFTAFLSINLGLLNLLPLPALDGGRLLFIIIEKIKGKPVSAELENKIHQIGFTLLLGLMAVVTVNDIIRILRR